MVAAASEEATRVRKVATEWVDRCWRADDSLFTPGEGVWTTSNLDELTRRFVEQPDMGSRGFLEKLRDQLDGAPPAAVQLMAELLYVNLLIIWRMRGPTKRESLATVLGWLPDPVEIPAHLDDALEKGIINPGQYYLTRRDLQLGYLIATASTWRTFDPQRRDDLLADPWAFRDFALEVDDSRSVASQRNAMLHLVHPGTFDPVVSEKHKQQIAEHYARLVHTPDADVDHQLVEIRAALTPERGEGFDWYGPGLRSSWSPDHDPDVPHPGLDRAPTRYQTMVSYWSDDPSRTEDLAQMHLAARHARAEVDELIRGLSTGLDTGTFVEQLLELPDIIDRPPVRMFLRTLAKKTRTDAAAARRLGELLDAPDRPVAFGEPGDAHHLARLGDQFR